MNADPVGDKKEAWSGDQASFLCALLHNPQGT